MPKKKKLEEVMDFPSLGGGAPQPAQVTQNVPQPEFRGVGVMPKFEDKINQKIITSEDPELGSVEPPKTAGGGGGKRGGKKKRGGG